ncbi:hypothetical protein SSX86_015788 [Deinandra increscens subsp. villosa]|uniref:Uncharacterized protein n=1 Tax=Deinandra increscens subsp. villosa TaxID=3103831 RepID=A0AAP0CWQ1_9ASTR
MKTKFFLCMRPTVTETEDGDYIKLPPSPNGSSRRNRQGKRVGPERYTRQLSVRSNGSNTSDGKPITRSASEPHMSSTNICNEKKVSSKKTSDISYDKVSYAPEFGPEWNSGACLMISSLFFTVFLGKFFGILCTLILVYSLYPHHRKNGGGYSRKSRNVVANSPEKGSLDYKRRVIMDGLLERKSNYRENNILFS